MILDEAHNIEDNCREAASFTFFEKEISDALTNIKEKGGCFLNRKYSLCVIFHLPFSEALTLKLIEKCAYSAELMEGVEKESINGTIANYSQDLDYLTIVTFSALI